MATNYGLSFFLPQIVKAFGLTNLQTRLVTAIPYVVGVISMVWWGHRSDRKAERRFHAAFPLFVAAAGIAASTVLDDPDAEDDGVLRGRLRHLRRACRCSGRCPPPSCPAPPRPPASPSSTRSAISPDFAGPYAMGWIKDPTGSYTDGLLVLAALGIVAMGIVLALGHDKALERAPAAAAE